MSSPCMPHEDILGECRHRSAPAKWLEWSVSRPNRSTPRERTPVPIDQKPGWNLEPLWTFPKIKISCSHWISNQDYSVVLSVAGKLHQLRYPVFQIASYERNFVSKIWRREVTRQTALMGGSSMKANIKQWGLEAWTVGGQGPGIQFCKHSYKVE